MSDSRSLLGDGQAVSQTVAALFVETGGVYFGLEGVDPWDEARDARLYDGPHPVVAHPPCNKWSPLAYINRKRLPNYVIGDDGGCFESALAAVEVHGGVLEHPLSSLAWKEHEIPKAARGSWQWIFNDQWVTAVDQGAYGHRAQKATQLLYVGDDAPPPLDWTPAPSSVVVSGFLHHTGTDESRRVRPREASRTPEAFRDLLLALARSARVTSEVAA